MKKLRFYAVFLCLFGVFLMSATLVFAQVAGRLQTVQDSGILPSNPFYFVKEFSRSVKRALTFDALKRLDFNLDVLDQRALELVRLSQVAPNKTDALTLAMQSYVADLEVVSSQLAILGQSGDAAGIDRALNRVILTVMRQVQLFDQLTQARAKDASVALALKDVMRKTIQLLASIPQQLEKPEAFRVRFQQIVAGLESETKDLQAAEALERLVTVLPEGSLRYQMDALQRDFLLRFGTALEQGFDMHAIETFSADPIVRLRLLDELRHIVTDEGLKNQLTLLRKDSLDKVVQEGFVDRDEAQDALQRAAQTLNTLKEKGYSSPQTDQAKFYFTQANSFFSQENFSGAFSQAILAIGAADEALRQSASQQVKKEELLFIKKEFDRLAALAKTEQLGKVDAAAAAKMLAQAEKLIAKSSDGGSTDLQEIKSALTDIDLLLTGRVRK